VLHWWQSEGDLLLVSALLLRSTTAKVALSGREKGTCGKNQGKAASGAPGSLDCSEFLQMPQERNVGSHYTLPMHGHLVQHAGFFRVSVMKNNALQLADTFPLPCLHAEKGSSVCVPPLRPSCSGVVDYSRALQDEGLCECGTVINAG